MKSIPQSIPDLRKDIDHWHKQEAAKLERIEAKKRELKAIRKEIKLLERRLVERDANLDDR